MNNNISMVTNHVLFNFKKGEYKLHSRATQQMQQSPKSLLKPHDLSPPTQEILTQGFIKNAIYSTIPFGSTLGESSPQTATSNMCTDSVTLSWVIWILLTPFNRSKDE